MNKTLKYFLIFSQVGLLMSCAPTPSESQKGSEENVITVTDLQNREITIDKTKVDRPICLGAGALRLYSYVGDVNKLVGVEDIDKAPFGVGTALRPYYHVNKDIFKNLTSIGVGGPKNQAPEKEKIISARPNIIISIYSNPEVNTQLQKDLNIPVVAVAHSDNAVFGEEFAKSVTLLGKIFNKEERATELNNYVKAQKDELAKLEMNNDKNYVGCIGNWGSTNLLGSSVHYPVLDFAKTKNIVDDMAEFIGAKAQVTLEKEKLVASQPDRIFLDGAGLSGFLADYKNDSETYDAMNAIKNGETYILLPYNAYYTNLEIQIISTYYVASVTHPANFTDFDIKAKANEVTKKFLGREIYDEMKEYSTAYGGYRKVNIKDLISE